MPPDNRFEFDPVDYIRGVVEAHESEPAPRFSRRLRDEIRAAARGTHRKARSILPPGVDVETLLDDLKAAGYEASVVIEDSVSNPLGLVALGHAIVEVRW